MTEKEKMLAGLSYNAGDAELLERWHVARALQQEYNATDSRDREKLGSILDKLLGSRGRDTWIAAPFFVDYGENIHLGQGVEINMNCVFLDCNRISIGDHSALGPGVQLYAVSHPLVPEERLSTDESGDFAFWKGLTAPVSIGSNVWIGGGSIVLPGVSIGDGSTIGAGSVVTRSIPERCVAVGNPCRVMRRV